MRLRYRPVLKNRYYSPSDRANIDFLSLNKRRLPVFRLITGTEPNRLIAASRAAETKGMLAGGMCRLS